MKEVMNVKDVAELFGMAEITVHRWVKAGKLPYFRIGRRLHFTPKHLEKLFESKMNEATK